MEPSDAEEVTGLCKLFDGETTGSIGGRGANATSVVRVAGVLPQYEADSQHLPSFFPTDEPGENSIKESVEEAVEPEQAEASSSGSVRSRIEAFEGMSETLSERDAKEESRKEKKGASPDRIGKLKVPAAFSTFVPGSMAHGSRGSSMLTVPRPTVKIQFCKVLCDLSAHNCADINDRRPKRLVTYRQCYARHHLASFARPGDFPYRHQKAGSRWIQGATRSGLRLGENRRQFQADCPPAIRRVVCDPHLDQSTLELNFGLDPRHDEFSWSDRVQSIAPQGIHRCGPDETGVDGRTRDLPEWEKLLSVALCSRKCKTGLGTCGCEQVR